MRANILEIVVSIEKEEDSKLRAQLKNATLLKLCYFHWNLGRLITIR